MSFDQESRSYLINNNIFNILLNYNDTSKEIKYALFEAILAFLNKDDSFDVKLNFINNKGIDFLFHQMQIDDNRTATLSSLLFRNLCVDFPDINKYITTDHMDILKKLFESENSIYSHSAISAIINLTAHENCNIVNNLNLREFIDVLLRKMKDSTFCPYVIPLLNNLLDGKDALNIFLCSNYIESVSYILSKDFFNNEMVVKILSRFIYKICMVNQSLTYFKSRQSQFPLLILLNSRDIRILRNSMIILINIYNNIGNFPNFNIKDATSLLIECGAVKKIHEILKFNYDNNENIDLIEFALSTISTLIKNEEVFNYIFTEFDLKNVIYILNSNRSKLERSGLLFIYNLCQELENIKKLYNEELVNSVVALLNKSSTGLCIKTIMSLSYDQDISKIFLKTNILHDIISLMRSKVEEISQVAISAIFLFRNHNVYKDKLSNLLTDDDNRIIDDLFKNGFHPIF